MRKNNKKSTLKEDIENFENGTISLNDLMGTLRIVSIVGTIFNAVIMFIIVVYSILCLFTARAVPREELVNNESFINYVSRINNYYHEEAQREVLAYKDTSLMVINEVVLPTTCVFIGFVGLIILCRYLYDFTKNVSSYKTLFTKNKLGQIKQIRNVGAVSSILIWLTLGEVYMLLWALFIIIMEIIIYMFSFCIDLVDKK